MFRPWVVLCLLLVGLCGCGGGGISADAVITRASESRLDPDATILASREVGGYVVPLVMAQSFHDTLRQVRAAFPETASIHAHTFYDPHELHFAIQPDAPWIAAWRAGQLTTGVTELDSQLKAFGALSVRFLSDEGDQAWFAVSFDTYLRAHRAAGLFIGKTDALKIASIVEPTGANTDTDIQFEVTTDTPPISRFTFAQGDTQTVIERSGSGPWTRH